MTPMTHGRWPGRLGLALLGSQLLFTQTILHATPLPWPLIFTQEPRPATDRPAPRQADGWAFTPGAREEGARLVRREPDGRLRPLTEGFAWAGEPAISHDGTRLLFSGRKVAGQPRQIWEMSVEGGEAQPVTTPEQGDCGDPEYGARNAINNPDYDQKVRWFVYTSDAASTLDLRLGRPARNLYVRTLEAAPGFGIVTWRTSYNPHSELHPTFLADGRVLYTTFTFKGNDPAPDEAGGRFFLAAMTWEGVGMNEVYGNHEGARLRAMPVELPDRTVLFVESMGEHPDGGGQLVEISWKRPMNSRRVLSRDPARYRDPHPLPDGRLIVARAEDNGSFGLWLFDRASGRATAMIHDDPAWDDVDGLAVAPHPEPMGRIPAIWPEKFQTGDLHCMNVYESSLPGLADLPRGSIRSVRIIEAVPLAWPRTGTTAASTPDPASPPAYTPSAPFAATAALRTRILGEVPVLPDGSFHLTLPADVPFTLQTLDQDGVAVGTMKSWHWLKPWFMRNCIGCHENREHAPQNRVTQSLHSLLQPRLGETTRQPTPDYVHDVQPILQARCGGGCHGPKLAEDILRPRLDRLSQPPYDRGYRTLVRRYVHPGSARDSPLIQRLRGGPPTTGSTAGPMASTGNERHGALLPAELRVLAAWIDLGAQWDATRHDIPVPGSPGPTAAAGADAAAARGHAPAAGSR